MEKPVLKIAVACLFDAAERLLVVRKQRSKVFMLPGGKAEAGETPIETVLRELNEELDLRLYATDLRPLGRFDAPAANEPGYWVEAQVFILDAPLVQQPAVQAELEELSWLALQTVKLDHLAPLLRERILPVLREDFTERLAAPRPSSRPTRSLQP